ncbi:MAG TPA: hypothetical protein VGN69_00900 [Solirubrobacteraceae bacterium]|jgi:hypothetical protein|nr:hypothetical protein [Solirubrobacteraceae bacterium]
MASARRHSRTPSAPGVQAFFAGLIVADRAAGVEVRRALRAGQAFVDATVTFADLTGDGRKDAIVRVDSAGAAGVIAVYVLSTDGQRPDRHGHLALRAIYRGENVYRASVVLRSGAAVVRVPRYAPGDDLCCPTVVQERTLAWHPSDHSLRVTAVAEVNGPRAPAGG